MAEMKIDAVEKSVRRRNTRREELECLWFALEHLGQFRNVCRGGREGMVKARELWLIFTEKYGEGGGKDFVFQRQ